MCSECHVDQAERLAAGPHHWDFSKRINTKYPTCVDCHGNHDIGNPPADFKLTDMCLDCHHKLDQDYPNIASVVSSGDRLAAVLREVRQKTIREPDPIPEPFRADLASLRSDTMETIHASKEITADQAAKLNAQQENSPGLARVAKIGAVNPSEIPSLPGTGAGKGVRASAQRTFARPSPARRESGLASSCRTSFRS